MECEVVKKTPVGGKKVEKAVYRVPNTASLHLKLRQNEERGCTGKDLENPREGGIKDHYVCSRAHVQEQRSGQLRSRCEQE